MSGTAAAGSTVTVSAGSTTLGKATANASGAWSLKTATLANGTYSVTAIDTVSGSSSAPSPVLNVIVDSPPPPVITSSVLNTAYQDVLAGTAPANSTVAVYDGTVELGAAQANSSGAWSFTTAKLSNGTHGFSATEIDAAGNISGPSSVLATTVNSAPIAASYFGMTIESLGYNYSYLGGPVRHAPTIQSALYRS